MVSKQTSLDSVKEKLYSDGESSVDLDEEEYAQVEALSAAANSKSNAAGLIRSDANMVRERVNDPRIDNIFNQEVANLKEVVYERGYDVKTEILRMATDEEQKRWIELKQELIKKDTILDHAATKIKLSYKGAVVDHKLGVMRRQMIEADHSLLVGEYYDKLEQLVKSPLYEVLK